MKKRNFLSITTILLLVLSLTNCNKTSDCCVTIDTQVQVHYQTQSGEDLINSKEEFNESNIRIYYKNGEEFEYIYQANLTYPKMYRLADDGNGNQVLTIFPSNFYEGEESTTLIELNENIVDTLRCEFELASNRQICKRAWLNGVEMEDRFITVKK